MYKEFFGLEDTPFTLTPDPRFIVFTPSYNEVLASLYYGLENAKGLIVLTGEVGTGKTTALRWILRRLDSSVLAAYVFNPRLSIDEFYHHVTQLLGIKDWSNKAELLTEMGRVLEARHARGLRTVLIIDEAHELSDSGSRLDRWRKRNRQGVEKLMFENLRHALADWIAPKLKNRRDEFKRLANTDPLTGSANRRAFDLAKTEAEKQNKIFVMFDGDKFGRVNKEVGANYGDRCITLLSNVVRLGAKLVNAQNRCFRIGGDEYAVIVETAEQAETLISFVEGFYNYEPILYGSVQVGVTGGYGVTLESADLKMQVKKKEKKAAESS